MPLLYRFALYALFFMSGIAGLGYEILWTRMLSVGLGHEIVSVLAVVSAFFTGLALGAWFLDRPVGRSAFPERWYAFFELIIGLWAVVLVFILPELNRFVSDLIGVAPSPIRHWSISFLYPLIVLLPATAAMGGTLPAMDRLFEKTSGDRNAVAGLYSANTFGAVAGILLVTFWLLPFLGMNRTSAILAVINIIGAATVLFLVHANRRKAKTVYVQQCPAQGAVSFYAVLFITGLAGMGFEVLIVRTLSQILENTVFSFAAMLLVFLFGTAAGAGIYHRWRHGQNDSKQTLSILLLGTASFCLVSIYGLRHLEQIFHMLQGWFAGGFAGAVFAELSLSFIFFLPPTLFMGATFSHLARSLRSGERGVGRTLCLNTLGGACAPLLFGVVLLPQIGIQYALLTVPTVYLLCFPRRRLYYALTGGLLTFALVVVALDSEPYRFISIDDGDTVVSHREGVMASVSVIKDARDGLHLKVNNHFQMGGTTSVFSDRRQAYLPLLLHPEPKTALFLGVGTGTTFAAAADFPDLKAEGVELIPEIISAMGYFEKVTGDLASKENLRVLNADARRYVMATEKRYDVIVADLFHPSRDGAASLYTLEHFAAIRGRLTENGIFCQWLPLYQLDLETFKVIARTFLEVFPEGQSFLAHYSVDQPIIGLLGGAQALRFPERWCRKRMPGKRMRRLMAGFGYDSVYSLLGTFMAGGEALHRYVGKGSINTDESPIVLFRAPVFVYGNQGLAHKRLLALLDAFSSPDPEGVLAEIITEEDYMARERLSAYWSARDSFLKLGAHIDRTRDVTKLHASVSKPLLKVVRKSLDFSAAYFPLLSIAYELYPYDRETSYQLFQDLERANPTRPEASILRQRLFVNRPS